MQGNLIVTNAFTSKIWIEHSSNDAICKKCAYLFLNCIFANYVAIPYSSNHENKLLSSEQSQMYRRDKQTKQIADKSEAINL